MKFVMKIGKAKDIRKFIEDTAGFDSRRAHSENPRLLGGDFFVAIYQNIM